VSMVCKGDSSLSVATTQRDLVKEIVQYTDSLLLPFDGVGVSQGAILSMLAIIMWFLVVMVEHLEAFSFMSGVFGVFVRGRRKGLRRTTVWIGGDELELEALSVLHVAGMCITVCVRLVVAAILLYVGVWWLQNTTALEDLVLNAASLSFIMQFDELVFSTMLTLRGRTRLRQLRPLPLPRVRKTVLLCVRPIVVSAGLVVLVFSLTPSLRENVRTMEELQRYMCGGRQNFVFAVMPSTGWAMTFDADDDHRTEGTFVRLAMEAAVWNESAVAQDLYFDVPSATLFTKLQTLTSIDNECEDGAYPYTPTRRLLSHQLGFEESWSCSDVPVHLCNEIGNSLLRQECPVRCGCREPRSPLFMTMSWLGCPETCSRTEEYILTSSQIPCSVQSAAEMRAEGTWPMWIEGYTLAQAEWGRNVSLVAEAFLQGGCEFARSNVHICYDSFNMSSVGNWCPVECGCREPRSAHPGAADMQCPPQCDAWVLRYETQLAQLRCEDRDASNFSQHEGRSFLTEHFETFRRTFTEDLQNNFTLVLGERGCDFLSVERHLCGSPHFLSAVCPVVCGCVDEPDGVGCPLSCAP